MEEFIEKIDKLIANLNSQEEDIYIDKTTGVLNTHALNTVLEIIILEMIKGKILNDSKNIIKHTFSIMVCDVNGLKTLNDTFGHIAGDVGLNTIGNIIKNSIRKEKDRQDFIMSKKEINDELVFRIGGDEFLIILRNCTKEQANKIKSRINEKIKDENSKSFDLSLAIGIADTNDLPLLNVNEIDIRESRIKYFEDLRDIADKRMYKNKIEMKRNIDSSEKNKLIMGYLIRIADALGIDIMNKDEFDKLIEYLYAARDELYKRK